MILKSDLCCGTQCKKLKVLGMKSDKIIFHLFSSSLVLFPTLEVVAGDILSSLKLYLVITLSPHGRWQLYMYPIPFMLHVKEIKYINLPIHMGSCPDILKHVTLS